jgi:hypothetical protein
MGHSGNSSINTIRLSYTESVCNIGEQYKYYILTRTHIIRIEYLNVYIDKNKFFSMYTFYI